MFLQSALDFMNLHSTMILNFMISLVLTNFLPVTGEKKANKNVNLDWILTHAVTDERGHLGLHPGGL